MDHFARLGLPAALDLEPAALDRAYFTAQRPEEHTSELQSHA